MKDSDSLGAGAGQPLAGRKLLILDGSKKAIEIVSQAQQLGVHTIITDYNSPEESPAKLAADEYFNISTADVDAVVQLIQRENIDGVLPGFSDRWLPTYAVICERAKRPAYATADQLSLFTDKKRYKEALIESGVPTVQSFTLAEAQGGCIPRHAYPLIVKPADGSGSRGISRCAGPEDLSRAIDVALDYSWTGQIVIERYIPGSEATAFWLFRDGEYFVTLVADRHMMTFGEDEFRLPVAYTAPSKITSRYLTDVAPKVRSMLRDAGIMHGMMFMQGIVIDDEFLTYDIGYRPTPTQEYRILERVCGYNPLKMLIAFAVTGEMGQVDLAHLVRPELGSYGFNVSTLVMPGEIGRYEGIRDVARMPEVLSVVSALSVGDRLPPEALGQLRQVAVRTVGVARSESEMYDAMKRVNSLIRVFERGGARLSFGELPPFNAEESDV